MPSHYGPIFVPDPPDELRPWVSTRNASNQTHRCLVWRPAAKTQQRPLVAAASASSMPPVSAVAVNAAAAAPACTRSRNGAEGTRDDQRGCMTAAEEEDEEYQRHFDLLPAVLNPRSPGQRRDVCPRKRPAGPAFAARNCPIPSSIADLANAVDTPHETRHGRRTLATTRALLHAPEYLQPHGIEAPLVGTHKRQCKQLWAWQHQASGLDLRYVESADARSRIQIAQDVARAEERRRAQQFQDHLHREARFRSVNRIPLRTASASPRRECHPPPPSAPPPPPPPCAALVPADGANGAAKQHRARPQTARVAASSIPAEAGSVSEVAAAVVHVPQPPPRPPPLPRKSTSSSMMMAPPSSPRDPGRSSFPMEHAAAAGGSADGAGQSCNRSSGRAAVVPSESLKDGGAASKRARSATTSRGRLLSPRVRARIASLAEKYLIPAPPPPPLPQRSDDAE